MELNTHKHLIIYSLNVGNSFFQHETNFLEFTISPTQIYDVLVKVKAHVMQFSSSTQYY